MATKSSLQIKMALQTLSESVYVGLCLKIGTPPQVAIRRDTMDIAEILGQAFLKTYPDTRIIMISGSLREGFRFHDSDMDTMHWPNNHRVLWDFSQAQFYNTHRQKLILCDSSESPPGFTLLWLPLEDAIDNVLSSCVEINGALYISSAKYRNNMCNHSKQNSIIHGPCSSGTIGGHDIVLEYDHAHCFVSDFWPPSASSWMDRCQSWPQHHVVHDIIRSGCHFVAIGHKHGNHADNEWRISFSQAEQKIVYATNHTQFLIYGLLKIFVKEFNSGLKEEEKTLCSYHMKTAFFWAIQQNTTFDWSPKNLLGGFWICFKLLLKWVYEGVCPNFFIPENNMFLNNVHGVAQKKLFTLLYGLYEKGVAFLLQSPSLSSCIMNVLCNPRLFVCTYEWTLISDSKLDADLFTEIDQNDYLIANNLQDCIEYLHNVEQLIGSPLTQCQVIMLQKHTSSILRTAAFQLHDMYTNRSECNKCMYIADKMSCYMLKLSAKFGFVSDLLYIAMYFYKTLRYREALSVIEMIKAKLAQPNLMYYRSVDPERYTDAVGGLSWSNKMRRAVARDVKINENTCMNELTLELQESSLCWVIIPSYIMLQMLEFLCCRHVNPMRAQGALDDLQDKVHAQVWLAPALYGEISWEILGICQQIAGDHQAALFSYQRSLTHFPFYDIQTATRHRIQNLQLPSH
uniref:Uncharacterized protein LOC111126075 isoform X2 n=1 Tax=Crassostrea virginica TaxID=6565 RepID=A0A8B8DDW3_CRAVI|nr:uncharacterized protein LOC111126075 isoform X2 [Crassostrea virginica]